MRWDTRCEGRRTGLFGESGPLERSSSSRSRNNGEMMGMRRSLFLRTMVNILPTILKKKAVRHAQHSRHGDVHARLQDVREHIDQGQREKDIVREVDDDLQICWIAACNEGYG